MLARCMSSSFARFVTISAFNFIASIYNDHQKGSITLRLNPDLRTLDLVGEALGVGGSEKDI